MSLLTEPITVRLRGLPPRTARKLRFVRYGDELRSDAVVAVANARPETVRRGRAKVFPRAIRIEINGQQQVPNPIEIGPEHLETPEFRGKTDNILGWADRSDDLGFPGLHAPTGARDINWDEDWVALYKQGEASPVIAPAAGKTARPSGVDALVQNNQGETIDPTTVEEWDSEWVSAGRTRNFALGDPLLDWLERYGKRNGFTADYDRTGYDERTDFGRFVMEKGVEFENALLALLGHDEEVVKVGGNNREDSRSLRLARRTVTLMKAGTPIIAQAVLRNPQNKTYGMPDLLVRSDVLGDLFPKAFEGLDEMSLNEPAPGIGAPDFHYVVVDIKYHSFDLLASGEVSGGVDSRPYLVQTWLYNEALGRIQGYQPPAAFLLGRDYIHADVRDGGAFANLARVDHDRKVGKGGPDLSTLAGMAIEWVRQMRNEGHNWRVLPQPSVPELYPHARSKNDYPWHQAKSEIAHALRELTLVPRMNPELRAAAIKNGLRAWDDEGVTADALGIPATAKVKKDEPDPPASRGYVQAVSVLDSNRALTKVVLPEKIDDGAVSPEWRTAGQPEFFVDFETTNSLDDDFSKLPSVGGTSMIFQIGCGHYDDKGRWRFSQWTTNRLTERDEAVIIDRWTTHMADVVAKSGGKSPRVMHWSAAETVMLETAYNSARDRHPKKNWPDIPWFDFLSQVIRPAPVTVSGAFNFGLKSIGKAMYAGGLIETRWGDGPTDGMGALVGAMWCEREARRRNVKLMELDLMQHIAAYNEIDCKVMSEIIRWLRENR